MTGQISRRTVLTASAAGLGTLAVAACSSSAKSSSAADPTGQAGAGSSAAGSSSAVPASGSAAAASTTATRSTAASALVALDSIKVGEAAAVKLPDGKPGIVARLTATTAVAFSAKCTHQGCTVKPAGAELDCPCHGSKFNALTGAVLHGPASEPLPPVDVHVVGGNVVAGTA